MHNNEYGFLKTMAILLVVIGHTTILFETPIFSAVTKGIYLFHMPLFMAMSGAVYGIGRNKGKYQEFIPFFKNKVLRLLVPYFFAGICVLAPVLIALGKSSISDAFTGIFFGNDCRHLWFLLSLFQIFMIAWMLEKVKVPVAWSFVVSMLLVPVCTRYMPDLYYCANNTVYYLPSFLFGMLLQQYPLKDMKFIVLEIVIVFVSAVVIKIQDFWYVDAFSSLLISNAIVALLVTLSRRMCPLRLQDTSWYKGLASCSFGIYLFHVPVIYSVVQIMEGMNILIVSVTAIIVSIITSILVTILIRQLKLNKLIGE